MLFGVIALSAMDKFCLGVIFIGGATIMALENQDRNRKKMIDRETLKLLKKKNEES